MKVVKTTIFDDRVSAEDMVRNLVKKFLGCSSKQITSSLSVYPQEMLFPTVHRSVSLMNQDVCTLSLFLPE